MISAEINLQGVNMIALPLVLQLLCVSEMGQTIHVTAESVDTETYRVSLQDSELQPMNVKNQKVTFNEVGDIVKIETSYLWESLSIERGEKSWEGFYWYDLALYPVKCSITNHRL